MHAPVDLCVGKDAFDPEVERQVRDGRLLFLWLAPPCSSFSSLRNLDKGGPLRSRQFPYGVPDHPKFRQAQAGNKLWRRALYLARIAILHGVPVVIEHPRGSHAWRLPCTHTCMSKWGLQLHSVDWCMYGKGARPQKPTRLLSNVPWLPRVLLQCDHTHVHDKLDLGMSERVKATGAYPQVFCRALAASCVAWFHDRAPSTTTATQT